MVKLRLKRIGKSKQPFYRIVATNSRVKRDGEYIELVGTYNPITADLKINKEIALKWLQVGAQPTDTVRSLLSKAKIMEAFHQLKHSNRKNDVTNKKTIKKQ